MRMMACFKPIILNSKFREKHAVYYIPEMMFKCNINRDKLIEIIKFTFTEKGRYNAFGFNKTTEEFWAKKIIKDKFLLHFTLNVKYRSSDTSDIIINLFVADDKELTKLLSIVESIIILYQPKPTIKL
jgi:hypothetical protein